MSTAAYPEPVPNSASRLGTAEAVLDAAQRLIEANTEGERGRKWAQIMGMFHGNPPYSPAEKRNTMGKWQANFNTGMARGLLDSACVPFYNLFEGGPCMVEIELDNPNPDEARRRSRVVSRHFNRLVKDVDISDQFYRLCRSFVGFGRGFWYWTAPDQWVPEVRSFYEVVFPERCPTDPKRWEFFVVRDTFAPTTLYGYADKPGWNREAIMQALRAANPQCTKEEDWIQYQLALKEQSVATDATSAEVDVVFAYAREFDGTWTCGVVAQRPAPADQYSGERPAAQWLYRKESAYKDVYEVLVPFLYDPADGRINSCEGLGAALFAPVRIKDRLANHIVDGAFLRTQAVLTPRNAGAQETAALTVVGGAAFVPAGFEVQNGQVLADIDGPLQVDRYLADTISRTSGIYLTSSERPIGNPDTATAAQLKATQQTMLTASGVSRFYTRLDIAWRTMYDRVIRAAKLGGRDTPEGRLAKEFLKSCEDEGIRIEELRAPASVRAYRVGGSGSYLQRQQNLGALASFVGAMPAQGRQAYFEEVTSATVGGDKVDAFFPQDMDTPGEGDWEARVENLLANSGAPPLFTPNQTHEAHIRGHLQALGAGLASVEQGAPAEGVYAFGQIMLPHVGQHLQAFGQDQTARDRVKAYGEQVKLLTQQYSGLPALIQEQAQAAQQQAQLQAIQQGQDPKVQIAAAQAQARTQIKAQTAAHSAQLKAAQAAQDMQLKAAAAEQDARIKAGKAVQDVTIKAAKARSGTETAK